MSSRRGTTVEGGKGAAARQKLVPEEVNAGTGRHDNLFPTTVLTATTSTPAGFPQPQHRRQACAARPSASVLWQGMGGQTTDPEQVRPGRGWIAGLGPAVGFAAAKEHFDRVWLLSRVCRQLGEGSRKKKKKIHHLRRESARLQAEVYQPSGELAAEASASTQAPSSMACRYMAHAHTRGSWSM